LFICFYLSEFHGSSAYPLGFHIEQRLLGQGQLEGQATTQLLAAMQARGSW